MRALTAPMSARPCALGFTAAITLPMSLMEEAPVALIASLMSASSPLLVDSAVKGSALLVVAAAAALVEKSANLSTKHWDGAARALEQARALRLASFELIEEDAARVYRLGAAIRRWQ